MPWGFLVIFSTWFGFLCAQVSSGIEILRFLPGINNNQSKTRKSSPLKPQPRLKSCFKFGTSIADNVTKVETLCPQRHRSGFDGTIHGFRKKFKKKLFPASLEMVFPLAVQANCFETTNPTLFNFVLQSLLCLTTVTQEFHRKLSLILGP